MDIKNSFAGKLFKAGASGGLQGINSELNGQIYSVILDWAIRHKERGEKITKEVLIEKMKSVFSKSKLYSKMFGYNDETIEDIAVNVMDYLNNENNRSAFNENIG